MNLLKILDKVTKAQTPMNFPCINLQGLRAALPPCAALITWYKGGTQSQIRPLITILSTSRLVLPIPSAGTGSCNWGRESKKT